MTDVPCARRQGGSNEEDRRSYSRRYVGFIIVNVPQHDRTHANQLLRNSDVKAAQQGGNNGSA